MTDRPVDYEDRVRSSVRDYEYLALSVKAFTTIRSPHRTLDVAAHAARRPRGKVVRGVLMFLAGVTFGGLLYVGALSLLGAFLLLAVTVAGLLVVPVARPRTVSVGCDIAAAWVDFCRARDDAAALTVATGDGRAEAAVGANERAMADAIEEIATLSPPAAPGAAVEERAAVVARVAALRAEIHHRAATVTALVALATPETP